MSQRYKQLQHCPHVHKMISKVVIFFSQKMTILETAMTHQEPKTKGEDFFAKIFPLQKTINGIDTDSKFSAYRLSSA